MGGWPDGQEEHPEKPHLATSSISLVGMCVKLGSRAHRFVDIQPLLHSAKGLKDLFGKGSQK